MYHRDTGKERVRVGCLGLNVVMIAFIAALSTIRYGTRIAKSSTSEISGSSKIPVICIFIKFPVNAATHVFI
jgi:hypothetical protein